MYCVIVSGSKKCKRATEAHGPYGTFQDAYGAVCMDEDVHGIQPDEVSELGVCAMREPDGLEPLWEFGIEILELCPQS